MPSFREMLVKCSPTHVNKVAADFTREFNTQTMQLVEPIRDWLAIPGQGELQGVVDLFFAIKIGLGISSARSCHSSIIFGKQSIEFLLSLSLRHSLLPLDVYSSI